MKEFSQYLEVLESLIPYSTCNNENLSSVDSIHSALDGQPAAELRRLVPLEKLRGAGAFFTGSKLAHHSLRKILPSIDHTSVILDPACGAGDLLIACTERLPLLQDFNSTVRAWGERIVGRDLHGEFVKASKIRLLLAALLRDKPLSLISSDADILFPDIKIGCGMSDESVYEKATHIVINPPFTIATTEKECSWGSGTVNSAAIFMENVVNMANEGTRIVAILPDVLRSGSRYHKWRSLIEKHTKIDDVELYGKFDNIADVDVFILGLTVRKFGMSSTKHSANWQPQTRHTSRCVDNFFSSCVGPVVDYRDPKKGQWHPFIRAKNLACWQTIERVERKRRFQGRLIQPPFVVVRRTSSPNDKYRALATIINETMPVAVENHLIVLSPHDSSIQTCEKLLENLKDPRTNEWLNQRIRCRHLTISSVAEIPWWSD